MSDDPHAMASSAAAEALAVMLADNAASPWDANDGDCENFAHEMIERLGGESDDVMMLDTLNFWEAETPGDTVSALRSVGARATLGLTLRQWAKADPGGHAWVLAHGRHYDAECLEGTENPLDLPLIARSGVIKAALLDKEIAAAHAHWKEAGLGDDGEEWRILHFVCREDIADDEFVRRVASECAKTDRPDLAESSACALRDIPGSGRWLDEAAPAAAPRP